MELVEIVGQVVQTARRALYREPYPIRLLELTAITVYLEAFEDTVRHDEKPFARKSAERAWIRIGQLGRIEGPDGQTQLSTLSHEAIECAGCRDWVIFRPEYEKRIAAGFDYAAELLLEAAHNYP
jgi:hypothetical protein